MKKEGVGQPKTPVATFKINLNETGQGKSSLQKNRMRRRSLLLARKPCNRVWRGLLEYKNARNYLILLKESKIKN